MLVVRVESFILRYIQQQFQIEDQLLLRTAIRGSVIVLLVNFMFKVLEGILLGLKALLLLLSCAYLVRNLI